MSTIRIIGSGVMAAAIGGLAVEAGYTVEVLSRDAAKARALAEQVVAGATTGTFGAVPAGDMVILAVPYAAVLDVVTQYGKGLAGKLLVDITNPSPPTARALYPLSTVSAHRRSRRPRLPTPLSSRRSTHCSPMSWLPLPSRAPVGRVHRWGRCAAEGTSRGIHRRPRPAPNGCGAATHRANAGAPLPTVAGPPRSFNQAHELLNWRQPSRLSALIAPLLAAHRP